MSDTVVADAKHRVIVRGIEPRRKYLVTEADGGWWIMPDLDLPRPRRRREWEGPKTDLADHLAALAALGFTLEPSPAGREEVPPCRF
jgi:hypothetical protein